MNNSIENLRKTDQRLTEIRNQDIKNKYRIIQVYNYIKIVALLILAITIIYIQLK